ncbi:MAG: septum formation protein Maf [Phycisphaerae bacterium]|nr:septum formation protein Maf [Phycisphaerae bacterium]
METKRKIILASGSPRRSELMRQWGYEFEVVKPTVDEPSVHLSDGGAGLYWAESLAYLKACAVAQNHPDAIVIGADTIVTHSNKLIGKPVDIDDARKILTEMFAGHNEVITGLAVLCPAICKRIIVHVTTTIIMRAMTAIELEDYLASGVWQGKAGAYAYQEGGDKFAQEVVGSESNIVGLPMEKLAQVLEEF